MSEPKPNLIRVSDRKALPEESFSHPLNPNSAVHGVSLGDAAGLQRMGIHLLRVPPGKESFVAHAHYGEEEFIYILAGRAMARIGDAEHEVGPGDFMGFPTPSAVHHLRNPFDEDVVYISGGERHPMEVADLVDQKMRLVRVGMQLALHPLEGAQALGSFPGLSIATPKAP